MHINIHSITLHIKEQKKLHLLLETFEYKIDIIAISKSKLKDEHNVNIIFYDIILCVKFTEAAKGGTMIYVATELDYKPREDLEICGQKNRINIYKNY